MWKKHKKEFIFSILAIVGIVFAMLLLVAIFEYFGVHVPGSREMWIGFIGAVIGGAFTFLGVLVTLYNQESAFEEEKRLENMPIIGFTLEDGYNGERSESSSEVDAFISYYDDEMTTSCFSVVEKKVFYIIKVKTLNNLCAFNLTVEGCAINGREIKCGSAFNIIKMRVGVGEFANFVFDYANSLDINIFCLLRFSYEDVFGNRYYQDLPFIYDEKKSVYENTEVIQLIAIRDIKQPIHVSDKTESLEEAAKKYTDYETFKKFFTSHQ